MKTYETLKLEVEDFINKIHDDPEIRHILKKHYKGVQILLSPLHINPEIMLIGINPGAGYSKYENRNVKRLNPMNFMEYVGGGYMLAKQTRKLFQLSGLSINQLKNTVKTNCCFIATTKAIELKPLLKSFSKYNYETISCKWITTLIEIVEPKMIVCEGKSAFDEMVKNYKCKVLKIDNIYRTNINGIPVVGYSRRLSYILDKEKVAKVIKETLAITEV